MQEKAVARMRWWWKIRKIREDAWLVAGGGDGWMEGRDGEREGEGRHANRRLKLPGHPEPRE